MDAHKETTATRNNADDARNDDDENDANDAVYNLFSIMSSTANCQSELQSALNLYWGFVGTSLGLTVVNILVCRICLRQRIETSPKLGAKLYISTGCIKILLGILLLTILHPKCPDGCTCSGLLSSYVYPFIVVLIGILWMTRGFAFLNIARNADGSGGGGKGEDTAVPTAAEMV